MKKKKIESLIDRCVQTTFRTMLFTANVETPPPVSATWSDEDRKQFSDRVSTQGQYEVAASTRERTKQDRQLREFRQDVKKLKETTKKMQKDLRAHDAIFMKKLRAEEEKCKKLKLRVREVEQLLLLVLQRSGVVLPEDSVHDVLRYCRRRIRQDQKRSLSNAEFFLPTKEVH